MKKHYVKTRLAKISSKNARHAAGKKMLRVVLMLMSVFYFGTVLAQECGTGETIVWDQDQNINGIFEVAPEDVLQILPGVNVVFETSASKLVVNGTILAEGTVDMPVTFSGSGPDGWSGIDLIEACPSVFFYCAFSDLNRNGTKSGESRAGSAIDISGTDNVTFESCTFTNNSDGIGISNSTGVVMMSCNFADNVIEPAQKGLIFIEGSSSDTIRNCVFTNNKTNLRGIISVNNGSHAVIQGNVFAQTRFFEPFFNGAIYSIINLRQSDSPNLLIVNSNEFTGSRAPQNNRLCEISIFGNQDTIDYSTALIWNNTFTGYPFPMPGQPAKTAIRANYSVLTITHNTIKYYNRSGIELLVSEAKINLNTFEANRTTMGAVSIDEYENYEGREINNVIFANYFFNNKAPNGPAIISAILPNENIHTTISQNTFEGNSTEDGIGRGGAIYDYYGSRLTIENNLFTQNSATNGGALCIENNAPVETVESFIKDNIFMENEATGAGGAVFAARSMITFQSNSIRNNQAPIGAGIYLDGTIPAALGFKSRQSQISFIENVITENLYEQAGGGCYLLNCQDADFVRNMVSFNEPSVATGDQFGGGLYAVNSNLEVYNSHFLGNVAGDDFGGIYLSYGPESSLLFYNSNVSGHGAAGGIVFSNPVTPENIHIYNSLFYENNQSATGKAVIYTGAQSIDMYNCYFDILPDGYDLNFVEEVVAVAPGWTETGIYYLDCDNSVCVDNGNPNEFFNDLPGANPPEVLFPSCGTMVNDIGISGGPYALDVQALFEPEIPADQDVSDETDHASSGQGVLAGIENPGQNLSVYPNPSTGCFTVDTKLPGEPVMITITDAFGRVLQQKLVREVNSGLPVDISGEPAGLYFVKLISGHQSFSKTIILR